MERLLKCLLAPDTGREFSAFDTVPGRPSAISEIRDAERKTSSHGLGVTTCISRLSEVTCTS